MNSVSKISFPGLGIGEFSVNSAAFDLFGKPIAWYALIITFGMICAVAYTIYMAKKIGVDSDDIIDIALFTIPIGIFGARLYYVLTKLEDFPTFWSVFAIWNGGLAIYGGIIAGALTVLVVCYYKKIKFVALADCISPGLILAQGIGRWGNFMNGEAFGYETDWFCRMGLQNFHTNYQLMYVHPTFLYESLWNLVGFALANLYIKFVGKKYDGQIFIMVFGWYGLGRMLIEGLRTDSLYIPGTELRISQVLAGAIFVVAAALLIYFVIKPPKAEFYHQPPKKKVQQQAKNAKKK